MFTGVLGVEVFEAGGDTVVEAAVIARLPHKIPSCFWYAAGGGVSRSTGFYDSIGNWAVFWEGGFVGGGR